METMTLVDYLNQFDGYKRNAVTTELLNNIDKARFILPSISKMYKGDIWDIFISTDLIVRVNLKLGIIETWEKKTLDEDTFEVIDSIFKIKFTNYMDIDKKTVVSRIMRYGEGYQVLMEATESTEKYNRMGLQIAKTRKMKYNPAPFYVKERDLNSYKYFSQDMFTDNFQNNINTQSRRFRVISDTVWISGVSPTIMVDKSDTDDYVTIYSSLDDNGTTTISFPLFYNEDGTIMIEPFKNNPLLQLPGYYPIECDINKIAINKHDTLKVKEYLARRLKLIEGLRLGNSELVNAKEEVAKLVFRNEDNK